MPRQARIDAPSAVHHIIIRGIEQTAIFVDGQDREDFIKRLSDRRSAERFRECARMRN